MSARDSDRFDRLPPDVQEQLLVTPLKDCVPLTAYDRVQAELSQRIATLESLRRDGELELEHRIALLRTENDSLNSRVDAAMRRIEQLEREVACMNGAPRQPIQLVTSVSIPPTKIGIQTADGIAIVDVGRDANGSPLPDEGT